jgi:hypothetical protein
MQSRRDRRRWIEMDEGRDDEGCAGDDEAGATSTAQTRCERDARKSDETDGYVHQQRGRHSRHGEPADGARDGVIAGRDRAGDQDQDRGEGRGRDRNDSRRAIYGQELALASAARASDQL